MNFFESRLNAVQNDHDRAYLAVAEITQKEEQEDLLKEGRSDRLIPELALYHLDYDRWIVRIIDADPTFLFSSTNIEQVYNARILDGHTLYLRSKLPQDQLKNQIEFSFLPF